jgi:hypothetical protein
MAHHHQGAIEWVITPENWSGRIEVISAIDGRVTNRGVARYADLEGRHLDPVSPRTFGPEVTALKVQTRKSDLYFAQSARTNVFRADEPVDVRRSLFQTEDYIQQVLSCDARAGEPVRVEKMVAFYTSRDRAISETLGSAGESAAAIPGSPRRSSATSERGTSCGALATSSCRGTIAFNSCCASTSLTSYRCAPATRPTGTPESRREASTARPTAGTSFGTSSTSIRS